MMSYNLSLTGKITKGFYKTQLTYCTRKQDPDMYRLYQEDQARLNEKFKKDLFHDFGVMTNPKAELCFSKAWERGHSAGLMDVYHAFSDLVELIQ